MCKRVLSLWRKKEGNAHWLEEAEEHLQLEGEGIGCVGRLRMGRRGFTTEDTEGTEKREEKAGPSA